jgi:disulfide bond formation protein DsbB
MTSPQQAEAVTRQDGNSGGVLCNVFALVLALAGAAVSVYLSRLPGAVPCGFCHFQRALLAGLAAVLAAGLLAGPRRGSDLSSLALPLAVAGGAVALHLLYRQVKHGTDETDAGLAGLGTIAEQSLTLFAVLAALLSYGTLRGLGGVAVRWKALLRAALLGLMAAIALGFSQ